MRQIKTDIGNEVLPNNQTDEANGMVASGVILKKGPWTSAEDAILVDYVRKHGEGNWNAVQRHSGLSRCGKSCRLRWANHLRPNLKKGAFTAEEERLIAELHAKMGNKWAHMAVHLPGRTDNEIKNYWNTRIKRRQRAGLPLYPPEVCMQALQESQYGQSNGGIDGSDRVQDDFFEKNSYEIHDAIFNSMKDNEGILPHVPELPDISSYNTLLKGLGPSQYCNFVQATLPNHKHFQESTMPYLGSSGMNRYGFYPFDHIRDNISDKIAQSFGMHSPLDPGPSSLSSICCGHSLSNGNSFTSKPTLEAVKLELPSFQYPEIDLDSWDISPPPPLLESVDVFIQSPPPISALESDCSSPPNSGLLDALLHQAKTLSNSKNHYSDKSSVSSTATPADIADSSTLNLHETEWEDYADTVSPFGATSFLNECPAVSANENSLDKPSPLQAFSGNMVKLEPVENQTMSMANITQPDILLASDWLEHCSGLDNEQGIMTDAAANLGNHLDTDYKRTTSGTSKSSQVWGLGSCAWNNMPGFCQVPDLG